MWQRWRDWLDDRTGFRQFKQLWLLKDVPGSARWRSVWGSCLVFLVAVEVITGILLMLAYSPSSTTAWGSVYFIQYELDFGWLIRGLHHFAAQALLVVLALYLLHMGLAGMNLPPGEVLWWLALLLLAVSAACDLTGNPLAWDQKGFWALQVELNIIGGIPGIGPAIQRWVLGGSEAGHLTLTRIYALHIVALPALLVFLLALHQLALRRYLQFLESAATVQVPDSVGYKLRKRLATFLILAVLVGLCLGRWGHSLVSNGSHDNVEPTPPAASWWSQIAQLGRWGFGAPLDAPADPARDYPIARPKWCYWFLFQLRRSLEGQLAIWATVFGPLVVGLILALVPVLAQGRARRVVYVVNVLLLLGLASAGVGLTAGVWWHDYGSSPTAQSFQQELHKQRVLAQRAVQLARQGIPVEGAAELLRRDPLTRGRELYQLHCASCHAFGPDVPSKAPVAPDLQGFASADWIYRLLQRLREDKSAEAQVMPQMASWIRREYERANRADLRAQQAGEKPSARDKFEEDLHLIASWLSTHPRRTVPQEGPEREAFEKEDSSFARGYLAYERHCLRCHLYNGVGGGDTNGPDLTGYGDAEWLRGLLHAPFERRYYGPSVIRWSRNPVPRTWMPAFRELEGADSLLWQRDLHRTLQELEQSIPEDDPKRDQRLEALQRACMAVHLGRLERELIIRFIRGDGRLVFGGTALAP